MRIRLPDIALTLFGVGFACAVVGCGDSQSQSVATTPVIRGDLIDAGNPPTIPAANSNVLAVETRISPPSVAPAMTSTVSQPTVVIQISPPQPAAQSPRAIGVSTGEASSSGDAYPPVGFDKLASYNFEVPDGPLTNQVAGPDQVNDQIPDSVKAFNAKKVSIKGFMLPLKVQAGLVTEFLILKDQSMCCYGNVPKITEWVSVKTVKGVKPIMDQPVSVEGTLRVGASRENGYLVGIYQMDGDKLIEPDGQ